MHATAIYTRAKELDCRIPDENAFSSFLSQFQSSINQSFREVKRFEYWRLILFWSQFYLAINSSLKEKYYKKKDMFNVDFMSKCRHFFLELVIFDLTS